MPLTTPSATARLAAGAGEQCDGGNVNNFDGYDARCHIERIQL